MYVKILGALFILLLHYAIWGLTSYSRLCQVYAVMKDKSMHRHHKAADTLQVYVL